MRHMSCLWLIVQLACLINTTRCVSQTCSLGTLVLACYSTKHKKKSVEEWNTIWMGVMKQLKIISHRFRQASSKAQLLPPRWKVLLLPVPKPSGGLRSFHSSTLEAIGGTLWVWGQPGLQNEFHLSQCYTEKLSLELPLQKLGCIPKGDHSSSHYSADPVAHKISQIFWTRQNVETYPYLFTCHCTVWALTHSESGLYWFLFIY